MARVVNAQDVIYAFNGVVIGCSTSADLTVSRAIDPATCGASGGWAQGSPGLKSWASTVNAYYRQFDDNDTGAHVSAEDVFDLLDDGSEIDVEYGVNTSGTKRFKGKAFLSEFKLSRPDSGNVTWSASLVGNGAIALVTTTVLPVGV